MDLKSIAFEQNQPALADFKIATDNSLPQTEAALSVETSHPDRPMDDFKLSIEDLTVNFTPPFTLLIS
jgi:hypothetical protein